MDQSVDFQNSENDASSSKKSNPRLFTTNNITLLLFHYQYFSSCFSEKWIHFNSTQIPLLNPVNKMNEDFFLLSFLQKQNSIRIKFEYIFVILTLLLRVLIFLLCKTIINIERSSINIYLDEEEIFFTVLHIIRLKRAQNPIIFWKSGIQNSWKMSYT